MKHNLKQDILEDLTKNRDHYKKLILYFKVLRDKSLKEENDAYTEDILIEYKEQVTQVVLEDMIERIQGNIDDIWSILEDEDTKLLTFLEPNH